jgi:hypothetical protein
MSTIAERVAAGAAFLDEHDPDWWRADVERAIDLDSLDLYDMASCVLGQRCPLETLAAYHGTTVEAVSEEDAYDEEEDTPYDIGSYYAYGLALERIAGDPRPLAVWATDHGFTQDSSDDWDALTAEWKRVITERRAAS